MNGEGSARVRGSVSTGRIKKGGKASPYTGCGCPTLRGFGQGWDKKSAGKIWPPGKNPLIISSIPMFPPSLLWRL